MANQREDPGGLACPNCGALLESGLDDQFFCEYCGSPLPERGLAESVSPSILESQDLTVPSEEAVMPDWLEEMAELSSPEPDDEPKRIELRPTAPPSPRVEVPGRRSSRVYVILIAILLALGFICLLGGMLYSVLSKRDRSGSLQEHDAKLVTVSAQSPWQSTGIQVRSGQVVSIHYVEGVWGVLGGARGAEKQTDAEGFVGEYRSVGLPLTNAPVGALLGRIGDGAPFLVGEGTRFRSGDSGAVRLMINDRSLEDNFGALRVEVQVSSAE